MIRTDSHIYLDYSATTPIDPEVSAVIDYHLKKSFGNASSVHAFGRIAKIVLEESREIIAQHINAEPSEVFFTSGGTESDNHALMGVALARRRMEGKNHILLSSVEHHAVLDCADYLRANGFDISRIPVGNDGIVDVSAIRNATTNATGLISIMHANNETGVLQPIEEITSFAREYGITVHSDTVQTMGKIPVDVNSLGVDLLAISAHKIYGPKGIGAIYIRKGTEIDAFLHGGAQERNSRAGTENVPLIAGFAKAVEVAERERRSLYENATQCKKFMIESLVRPTKGIAMNGDAAETIPHILNISLDSNYFEIDGETLVLSLDLKGIAVSSGSACTSGSVQPSHVLIAMGRDEAMTKTAIRFSFGKYTTIDEVRKAAEIFGSIIRPFRKNH